jgi:hypothetical protein
VLLPRPSTAQKVVSNSQNETKKLQPNSMKRIEPTLKKKKSEISVKIIPRKNEPKTLEILEIVEYFRKFTTKANSSKKTIHTLVKIAMTADTREFNSRTEAQRFEKNNFPEKNEQF